MQRPIFSISLKKLLYNPQQASNALSIYRSKQMSSKISYFKRILFLLSTIIPSDTTPSDNTFTDDYELMNKTIVFKIANTEVDVYWLDNNSVKELKKLAKD